jgi:hypothetical protein
LEFFFFEFFESDGGRLSRRRISQRPTPGRRERAAVRTTSIAHHLYRKTGSRFPDDARN